MKSKFNVSAVYWKITILLIIAKLCLHLFTNTNYELHRDEMLYFNMADNLSFGYATVPPLTGFLAFIVKGLFGYSVFGIRLLPAILGALSLFIIAKIIRKLGGGILALTIAGTSFLLSPGFLLIDTLFTPNVTEEFLWLLITYFIFRMVKDQKPGLWLLIGVLLGISFLNKYSVVFFISGFLVALLISNQRKLLTSRYFFMAMAIGIIIILPNILWQFNHGLPVISHMSELKRTQLDNMRYNYFLEDVLSLNLASVLVWIFGLCALLFFRNEKEYRYLGVASLLIILLFLVLQGKAYYMMGLIPFLIAFGSYTMEKYLKDKLAWINYSVISVIVISSLAALPGNLPLFSFNKYSNYLEKAKQVLVFPFLRWEDGKIHDISQVYSDMTGWTELAEYVAKAFNKLSEEEKKNCTIFGQRNYGYAGAINFYGKQYNLPQPITFLESYVFWAPDTIPDGPFIYINCSVGDLNDLFSDITEEGCVRNRYFRENGLKVFLCKSPKVNIPELYKKIAQQEKSAYN
ncbi:MAG: glycosyltransferase family 39 protein [Bacteroidales bacterium]|nr:glycosyltransferase family 39 protein [Bacteroidales bacterium]